MEFDPSPAEQREYPSRMAGDNDGKDLFDELFIVFTCMVWTHYTCAFHNSFAFMQYCEICRIYNNCLLLNEELLRDLCNYCQQKQFNAKFREWIQNYYGQVVASQYTGIAKLYVYTLYANSVICSRVITDHSAKNYTVASHNYMYMHIHVIMGNA